MKGIERDCEPKPDPGPEQNAQLKTVSREPEPEPVFRLTVKFSSS